MSNPGGPFGQVPHGGGQPQQPYGFPPEHGYNAQPPYGQPSAPVPPGAPQQPPYGAPSAAQPHGAPAHPYGTQPGEAYGQPTPYGQPPAPGPQFGGPAQPPYGYGATPPPPPKKGFPVWAMVAIPLALLLLIGGGVLLGLRPWEQRTSPTSSSSHVSQTSTPTPGPTTSKGPTTPPVTSSRTSTPPAPTSSGPKGQTPTGTSGPLAPPGSTKRPADIVTAPPLTGYQAPTAPTVSASTAYRVARYSAVQGTKSLNLKIAQNPSYTTEAMRRLEYHDIVVFENFACGQFIGYDCVTDIADGGSLLLGSYDPSVTPAEIQERMRELLTKI